MLEEYQPCIVSQFAKQRFTLQNVQQTVKIMKHGLLVNCPGDSNYDSDHSSWIVDYESIPLCIMLVSILFESAIMLRLAPQSSLHYTKASSPKVAYPIIPLPKLIGVNASVKPFPGPHALFSWNAWRERRQSQPNRLIPVIGMLIKLPEFTYRTRLVVTSRPDNSRSGAHPVNT